MLNTFKFDDPVHMHETMCERFMFGDNSDPQDLEYDWTHGTEVGLHNVTIGCKSIDFDYDFKKLWVPPTRWKLMVRQYIDPVALADCLAKIEERMTGKFAGNKGRGIAVLRTRLVQGKGTGRGVRRRWGSCMLNLSFRNNPIPTVTLNSRTTYFGYLALVDVAVARAFAAECSRITGTPLADIQFVWRLDLAQYHGFRSLAWALGQEDIRKELDDALPGRLKDWPSKLIPGNQVGFRKSLDGYARIKRSDDDGVLYGDESFSSFARVRRRYHTEVFGPEYAAQFIGGTRNGGGRGSFPALPTMRPKDMDLSPLLGRPGDNSLFDEDDDFEDDDE